MAGARAKQASEDSRPSEWSDRKKWTLDLVSSTLLFFLATAASYCVLDSVTDRRVQTQHELAKAYDFKTEVIQEFWRASHAYTAAAFDAKLDYDSGKKRGDSKVIRDFQDHLNDTLGFRVRQIEVVFVERSDDFGVSKEAAEELSRALKQLGDTKKKMWSFVPGEDATGASTCSSFEECRVQYKSQTDSLVALLYEGL